MLKNYKESKIQPFISSYFRNYLPLINSELSPKLDLSIDGMRSQQFSEGIFLFLMLGIAVFSGIVFVLGFGKKQHGEKKARRGEMVIFGLIILGIIAAVIMAALQMLGGYLL